MVRYENIGRALLVSYDKEAVMKFLARKGENLERIHAKGWHVETYFVEDDLNLILLDERAGQEEATIICIQDFYINTDVLIDLHDAFRTKTKDRNVANIYKYAVDRLASIITMVPTFQEYYYKYNQSFTSKVPVFEPLQERKTKAA
jgi:aminoglycoside/choline kinase family phosphotransferase